MTEPIRKITLKDGGTRYRVVVDVGLRPNGRRDQRTMTFRTYKDARAAISRTRSQVDSGVYVAPSKANLDSYLEGWLAGKRGIKASTRSGYVGALRHVREACGQLPLAKVTKADLDAMVTRMIDRGLSARTIVLTLTVLSQALDAALREGTIPRNVAALVERPRQSKPEMRRWTEDEMRTFLRTVSEHRLHAAWRLSLYGLRRGEVMGLRWSDVDLDAPSLTVWQSRITVDGREVIETPKSARSARTLPLDDALAMALRALRTQQSKERLAAGEAYDGASGLVVVDELGRPWRPELYSDTFGRLATVAGVPVIRLHDCRHTALSVMVDRGVPISVVSAWAGHADPAFTLRQYVHTTPAGIAAAGAALGAVSAL
jgi:integrase